ncbi:hypothetical protein B0T14DRAFT_530274 [Immersiella caudata]|uniref:Uncharacterized protein n=1 Tax=Immersiella caudata TaxID=314043 RepID=A0AA39U2Z1_9PEZI|nr:hypothetical protein B0T14DRAFT_530274 [Immersiella caudata]
MIQCSPDDTEILKGQTMGGVGGLIEQWQLPYKEAYQIETELESSDCNNQGGPRKQEIQHSIHWLQDGTVRISPSVFKPHALTRTSTLTTSKPRQKKAHQKSSSRRKPFN